VINGRQRPHEPSDPEPPEAGPGRKALEWTRRNLFSSVSSTLITVGFAYLLYLGLPRLIDWALLDATIGGTSREACRGGGACWTFISFWLNQIIYGRFPVDARWRIDMVAVLLVAFAVPALFGRHRTRALGLAGLFLVFPPIAGVLIVGGVPGLARIDPGLLGGLALNITLAFAAGAASLPLGIMLALGRRSRLPFVRLCSVAYIEFWRGIPLITVLFTALVLMPLFLPRHLSISPLVRALVAITLFYAAYVAEVVRGGLQALPPGQTESANALGLSHWQTMFLVVLPQAIRLVVPGLVNTVIELFKDSTLVYVIGLFDVLGVISLALRDIAWIGYSTEGYVFVGFVYFSCCFAMSLYSRRLERRRGDHGPQR
jgi:general L-amino acid transport system permease protein